MDMKALVQDLLEDSTRTKPEDISRWLGAYEPDQDLESFLATRTKETCNWIFNNAAYKDWVSSHFPANNAKLFWLYGPAGFGKTILCAQIIRRLQETLAVPLAYFFCTSEIDSTRDPMAILQSWTAQLIKQSLVAFNLAKEMKTQNVGRTKATRSEVWKLFKSIVGKVPDCTFIVDGFDECHSPLTTTSIRGFDRQTFLHELQIAVASVNTRILILSRGEADIKSQMLDDRPGGVAIHEHRISGVDVKHDNSLVAKASIDDKLPKKDNDLREELAEDMAERCEGMFLQIKLQKDRLRGGLSPKRLRAIAADMPRGLDQAYDRDMKHILGLESRDRERAFAILRWVVFATRPLTIGELTEALVVPDDDDVGEMPDDELPEEMDEEYVKDELVGLCGSLLEIRPLGDSGPISSRTVHLVHFTVKQYLLSTKRSIKKSQGALAFTNQEFHMSQLCRACLRFLNYSNVWTASQVKSGKSKNLAKGSRQYHFASYAVHSWYLHCNQQNQNREVIIHLVNQFFDTNNPNWELWRNQFETEEENQGQGGGIDKKSGYNHGSGNRLYYASMLGLVSTVCYLLKQGFDIDLVGGRYGCALQVAIAKDHGPVVDFLLDCNANINTIGGLFESPLGAAAASDNMSRARRLIELGANVNGESGAKASPLYLAALRGLPQMVKMLLEKGAEVNRTSIEPGWTPLNGAVAYGRKEIVQLLLRHKAIVTIPGIEGRRPLHSAAIYGRKEIVQILLENGSDINFLDHNGSTPLKHAASNGHQETVQLFLEKGADFTISNYAGWTPLASAAYNGYKEVAQLLIKKGADFTTPTPDGWTPLALAASNGHKEMVQLLFEKGADFDYFDIAEILALGDAAQGGHLEIFRLLLEIKADGKNLHDHYGNTLQDVALGGNITLVQFLLDNGAPANTQGGGYGNALQAAASINHINIFDLLIQHGADINRRDLQGRCPLAIAMRGGHDNMVQHVLGISTAPIDLTQIDKQGCSLLHAAASGGSAVALQAVLAVCSALDINSVDSYGWTALHWACRNGSIDTVQMLKDRGADNQLLDMEGRTALEIAVLCQTNSIELVTLLNYELSHEGEQAQQHRRPGGMAKKSRYFCDNCLQDIYGTRYKCEVCGNFDFCFRCIVDAGQIHDPGHVFKAIQVTE